MKKEEPNNIYPKGKMSLQNHPELEFSIMQMSMQESQKKTK